MYTLRGRLQMRIVGSLIGRAKKGRAQIRNPDIELDGWGNYSREANEADDSRGYGIFASYLYILRGSNYRRSGFVSLDERSIR